MRKAAVVFLCGVACSGFAMDQPALPDAWRALSPQEMRVVASADLNGDGRVDWVQFVKSKHTHDDALLVYLSAPNGKYRWQVLHHGKASVQVPYLSQVRIYPPGTYEVACVFTPEGECILSESGSVYLTSKLPVVRLEADINGTGSTPYIFYWDKGAKRFITGKPWQP